MPNISFNVVQKRLSFTVTNPQTVQFAVQSVSRPAISFSVSEVITLAVPGQSGGGGTGYTHTQSVASATWLVAHGLGYRPGGIVVIDSAGTQWMPDSIHYIDADTLEIRLGASSFSGTAYIS